MTWRPSGRSVSRVSTHPPVGDFQDKRYRSVIHRLNDHVGAEASGLDRYPPSGNRSTQPIDQRRRVLGRSRLRERWPPAPADVPVQGELADDEHFAIHVGNRAIQVSSVIGKDPKTGDLVRESVGFRIPVLVSYAH